MCKISRCWQTVKLYLWMVSIATICNCILFSGSMSSKVVLVGSWCVVTEIKELMQIVTFTLYLFWHWGWREGPIMIRMCAVYLSNGFVVWTNAAACTIVKWGFCFFIETAQGHFWEVWYLIYPAFYLKDRSLTWERGDWFFDQNLTWGNRHHMVRRRLERSCGYHDDGMIQRSLWILALVEWVK